MPYNFDDYRKLIAEVDQSVKDLSELHKNHMLCKKGCDLCCMDYSVFPVEYMAIKEALKNKSVELQESVEGSCIFSEKPRMPDVRKPANYLPHTWITTSFYE